MGDQFTLNDKLYNGLPESTDDSTLVLSEAAEETYTGRAIARLNKANVGDGLLMKKATVAGAYTMMNADTVANAFLAQINEGINVVVSQRARLGAIQSRMERTAETISINIENTTNADSVIRDADMAQEISALVRAQILAQAGSAVLNQANLLPQSVLSLLQALT
ncbi:MAG: hypothetical protein KatS3mg115_1550 [Candidatus Poribacteria bacterium]|nr:MAG: hypothetical protein KatS3mg115_1550 [Candidatus Poribacteria bacterium]